MQFSDKFVSSEQKFVNDFIYLNIIISNIIESVEFLIFNESRSFLATDNTV